MGDRVVYVYGIAPAALDVSGAPCGLDDAPVIAEREGAIAAIFSYLDATTYAGGTAEARAGDVAWIGPRAIAHDAVLTWASDAAGVVPFPMFTLFSNGDALRAMLRDRHTALSGALERVIPAQEYTLRIFRVDSALQGALASLSPRLAEISRQAEAAAPGQRYLLQRKLETERRAELRRIASEVAAEAYRALAEASVDAVRSPLPASRQGSGGAAAGEAALDASFLVRRDATGEFQHVLTELVGRYEPAGFRFELTGPWPAYHFVREAATIA
jgi:hypothetical protein